MGTKGRDLAVWIFFVLAVVGIFTPCAKYVLIPDGIALSAMLYFYDRERPRAIRYSQVALVPVNKYWARLLTRKHLHCQWENAYEVHIYFSKEPLKQQRNTIVSDLVKIKHSRPGLYLFETHVSLPMPIRHLLDELEKDKLAFWQEGVFFPRPPFVYTKKKSRKKLHHGAAIIQEKED